jgi:penicillin-binding protein 2
VRRRAWGGDAGNVAAAARQLNAGDAMTSRLRLLLALMFTVMVIFTGRLMYLQFAMAEEFKALSAGNVLEERRISPLRGRILARDGTVLADNRIAVDLMYWGGEIEHWERIAFMLGLTRFPDPPDMRDPNQRLQGRTIAWNIPDGIWPAIEELVAGQPNLYLRERIERTYPTNLAPQVVGYTTEADPQRFPGYALGELVGQAGIEASFQEVLFGRPGAELAQVNNRRVTLSTRQLEPAYPGQDVVLTLDPRAQRIAEEVLRDALLYVNSERRKGGLTLEEVAKGALIALNPKTGEILAMASVPTYDQNIFTKRPSDPERVTVLLSDNRNFPLANRAVSEYEPASTFKLVTSSALLEGGFVSPNARFSCSPTFRIGNIVWRNWANFHRGAYDVRDAIADSCNTYYWNAIATTPDALRGWSPFAAALVNRAREFGFGERVGVGLLEERPGRIPDQAWVREYYGHGWLPGYTINAAIGQGDVLATPLQVAQLISTLALKGTQVQPRLVKGIGDEVFEPVVTQIPGRYWQTLEQGMRMALTNYPSGRRYLGSLPVQVAGKTGTAQNPRGEGYFHAWFMGYAPMNDPEIAIVVFIEHGGSSTAVALPVARDFLVRYFELDVEVGTL